MNGLAIFWFAVIAILWVGYFFLEGFDFGVATLLPFLTTTDVERQTVIRTIGPVWDGNEVWLLVAGGATFAAFPQWYATLFSGFYLALFLILMALILRGVAFEFRHQRSGEGWRRWWDRALFWGSALPAFLWGVAFANILHGVPIDVHHEYTGTLLDLLGPYALVGGLTWLGLFALHGACFLCLRLEGDLKQRAENAARRLAWPVTGVLFVFLAWTYANAVSANNSGIVPSPLPIAGLALVAVVASLVRAGRHGFAFAATGMGIALTVATVFLNLYPRVLVSSTSPDFSLTIGNASSTSYTLTVMTVVALVFTPIVLLYQAWTYWIFRQRVTQAEFSLPAALQRKSTKGSE